MIKGHQCLFGRAHLIAKFFRRIGKVEVMDPETHRIQGIMDEIMQILIILILVLNLFS